MVTFCHKFQRIPSLMALRLSDDTNSHWFLIGMSLPKQYFDDWLVSVKQQDCIFSTTKKQSNHSWYIKGLLITRGSYIFRIRSVNYILSERFSQQQKISFNLGLVSIINPLLRNLGYNNHSTQHQIVFQPTAKNLLSITSVNIIFS